MVVDKWSVTELIRDAAGNLYGTTFYGGRFNYCDEDHGGGTVFKIDTTGKTIVLHAFDDGPDGCFPSSGLVLDTAGNL